MKNDWKTNEKLYKVNAPVCDPVSVYGHFFIYSSIDAANDKKNVR